MRSAAAACVVAALLLSGPSPARAQVDSREGIALQNEIYQLRQDLRALQDQIGRGGGGGASYTRPPAYQPPPQSSVGNDLVAQLLTRVDALEEQVRTLRGRIDETENQVQRQGTDTNKRIDDLAFQINSQAGGAPAGQPPGSGAGPAVSSPDAAPPPPKAPVKRTPEIA